MIQFSNIITYLTGHSYNMPSFSRYRCKAMSLNDSSIKNLYINNERFYYGK